MMPLTMAAANEINYIKKVGGNSEVKRHLETLGFVAGGEVSRKRYCMNIRSAGDFSVKWKSDRKHQRFQSRDQQRDGKQDHGLKEEEGK